MVPKTFAGLSIARYGPSLTVGVIPGGGSGGGYDRSRWVGIKLWHVAYQNARNHVRMSYSEVKMSCEHHVYIGTPGGRRGRMPVFVL